MTGQKSIFIIEDNFMYAYFLRTALGEYGNFRVTAFSSAEEAIAMLGNNNPDLVIMDYNLNQEMNGLDLFNHIHDQKPKLPVIVLSGQADVGIAAEFLRLGAFEYIEKKNKDAAMQKLQTAVLKALR